MKKRLNDRMVERLKTPEKGRVDVWDSLAPGLFLVLRSSGRRTFRYRYRTPAGKRVSAFVGEHPTSQRLQALKSEDPNLRILKVDEARKAVDRARLRLLEGKEPFEPTAKATKKSGRTLADVVELYAVQKLPKLRRGWEQERILRKDVLPQMGHLAPEQVTGEHVLELMESIGEPPPLGRGSVSAANAAKRALSAMFGWMSKPIPGSPRRHGVTHNPCLDVGAYTLKERNRVYNADEIYRIWTALESGCSATYAAFRVAFLTVQRIGSVLSMQAEQLDLAGRVWCIPPENMKNGRGHWVPLSGWAVKELEPWVEQASPWVFPSVRREGQPISSYNTMKTNLRRQTGIRDFNPHDLRRTAITLMDEMGIERSDIRLVASHAAPQGALKHYSFARGASPRARRAMDRWAERLSEIVGGTAGGQVVSFPGNS